ncbi:glutamyl-tRNA reductase [Deinococcus cellulosilyticus]|uniref:Glutamyl-tRNA reductase n=1 Tax=Deinococcus cellulosilyticus (strain DSM 18568 / NBRC 106333 / KACC 11606 / 5516J-15) TaxID=1223518 RepID=A0A511NB29_DEIC1|nr:glutamyl-tRNA reductase [Deinococcus cellulosilyticus]GEM50002.1 hypothetical protein DC3_56370 [Deinococcus cellulosilyticus NBRC 106333 = KACC 11606]
MKLYPLFLDLKNQDVLVVGAGKVGLRKTRSVLESGARVTVVSPEFLPEFAQLPVRRVQRAFDPTDLQGRRLVFACSNQDAVNDLVAELAAAQGTFCLHASKPEQGNLRSGAVWRKGDVTVAFSSGTELPMLTLSLKQVFEAAIPNDFSQKVTQWSSERAMAITLPSPARENALMDLKETIQENLGMVSDPLLNFVAVGVNHKTAPLSVRERIALRPEEFPLMLEHLQKHAREVMILSTCNRTEVYMAGVVGDPLSAFEGAWGQPLREYLYIKHGLHALKHLTRVASGLDSLVLGETQILGQVKRAWQDAHNSGNTGSILNKATQLALQVGKRVRTETGIADKAVSVSYAAVELAKSIFGDLQGKTALIVGAGETAELTMTHLKANGIQDVIVVNRTVERAQKLAEAFGGQVCAIDMLLEALPKADVVIASSSAPHYVIRAEHVRNALKERTEPMFLIDISVPRILEPEISHTEGAYLYNLDDLTAIVERNLAERAKLIPHAETLIEEGLTEFKRWFRQHHKRRELKQAQQQARQVAQEEFDGLESALLRLGETEKAAVLSALQRATERMGASLIRELLHQEKEDRKISHG